MPDEKITQKPAKHADDEPKKAAQEVIDDTVGDSFPASDPPAWTTTSQRSVVARRACDMEEDEKVQAKSLKTPPTSSRLPGLVNREVSAEAAFRLVQS